MTNAQDGATLSNALFTRWGELLCAIVGASLLFATYCRVHTLFESGQASLFASLSWGAAAGAPAGVLAWSIWRICPNLTLDKDRRLKPGLVVAAVFAAVSLGGALIHGALRGMMPSDGLADRMFDLFPIAALSALATWLLIRPVQEAPIADETPTWIELPGARNLRIRACDIDVVRAAGNYCEVSAAGKLHLVRMPLSEFAARLACHGLVQVHRSAAVNRSRLVAIKPRPPRGRMIAHLDSGQLVPVGDAYAKSLINALPHLSRQGPARHNHIA